MIVADAWHLDEGSEVEVEVPDAAPLLGNVVEPRQPRRPRGRPRKPLVPVVASLVPTQPSADQHSAADVAVLRPDIGGVLQQLLVRQVERTDSAVKQMEMQEVIFFGEAPRPCLPVCAEARAHGFSNASRFSVMVKDWASAIHYGSRAWIGSMLSGIALLCGVGI